MDDFNNWRGKTVVDQNGNKIGVLKELYLDDDSGRPSFGTVATGLFGTKESFFPVSLARVQDDDTIMVEADTDKVKGAPRIDVDEVLNPDEEKTLYEYYGLSWNGTGGRNDDDAYDDDTDDRATGTAAVGASDTDIDGEGNPDTVGRDTSGPTTDSAMTRSEEELQVGTEQRETGRARLKKYVVTEHVQTTVPVSREEVRIEREPITDENMGAATTGPDLSDEEHEVVLNEEVPVVDTKVVPKERVKLDKTVVQDERQVGSDVRKEQIDLDGDGRPDAR
ncbi:MAG TPA: PRC and DUF2382 domain-containing protein [Candidatus Limnocylindrales bacterium]|nr:PRC and DUF2382 domain-containing protein [Candidatus Limnocylindrales bacterium]